MDDEETPFITGFLTIKSQNGFSIRISKKPKFCQIFKASRNGIERLEISDSETDKNTRIVTLENCVKIVLEQPNTINIVTKTGQIQLHSTHDVTVKQWKTALQSVAFKEKSPPNSILSRNAIIEEDNDLYCSSYSEGLFTVTLIPTDASLKCGLESKMYTLMLSTTEIQLKCYEDESIIIAKWPYRFIRKYGYRDGKFTFEAGRKCDTGEGTFKLDNNNPQEIFRCMSTKMKSMKKIINGESYNSSTLSMQNQLSILSMEPGSRSPLPPTSQSSFMDVESHNSFRGLLSSPEIVSTSSSTSATLSVKNGIPSKPPRKIVPLISEQRSHCNTSNVSSVFIQNHSNLDHLNGLSDLIYCNNPVPLPCKGDRDYECVEDITEAWKKLGIDEVNHTENAPTSEDELREFARERSKSSREFLSKYRLDKIPAGDDQVPTSQLDDNYDKLDFFRTTHKVSSGYKTIVPIKLQVVHLQHGAHSSDDYEIVGDPTPTSTSCRIYSSDTLGDGLDNNANVMALPTPDTSACRKADDSYLGYGMIRKPSLQAHPVSISGASTMANLPSNDEDTNKGPRFDYATPRRNDQIF